jgi:hypothetical protein
MFHSRRSANHPSHIVHIHIHVLPWLWGLLVHLAHSSPKPKVSFTDIVADACGASDFEFVTLLNVKGKLDEKNEKT